MAAAPDPHSDLLEQLKAAFGSGSFALSALVAFAGLMKQPPERRKAAALLLRKLADSIELGTGKKGGAG